MASDVFSQLLPAANRGDRAALDRLVGLAYDDLRGLARCCRATFGSSAPSAAGLVSECYLRLCRSRHLAIRDRSHFLNLSACIMRQLLRDASRRRSARRRGGGMRRVALQEVDRTFPIDPHRYLDLDQALDRLYRLRPLQARVVACRFRAGLSEDETARILGRSRRSVQRDWRAARTWLAVCLSGT